MLRLQTAINNLLKQRRRAEAADVDTGYSFQTIPNSAAVILHLKVLNIFTLNLALRQTDHESQDTVLIKSEKTPKKPKDLHFDKHNLYANYS